MELALQLTGGGVGSTAVVVDIDERATVADLALALAGSAPPGAGGGAETPLFLGSRFLDPDQSLVAVGVTQGAAIGVGAPLPTPPERAGPMELAVVSGPASGRRVEVRPGDSVTVGRSPASSLIVDDPSVSRRHAELAVDDEGAWLRDCGSANGVGWDGRRIDGPVRVAPGDAFQVGDSILALRRVEAPTSLLDPVSAGAVRLYSRPPRIAEHRQPVRLELPAEPEEPTGRRFPLVSLVAPVLLGVVLFVVLKSVTYLAFIALSPLMAVSNYISDSRHGRREYRQKLDAYQAAVADLDRATAESIRLEQRRRRDGWPDPAAVARIAATRSTRLWERRVDDDDFLVLRVGLGDAAAELELRTGRGAEDVAPPVAHTVPILVDLPSVGVVGFAATRANSLAMARAAVLQAAVLHSPRDLRIVVLTGPGEAPDWDWVCWLPHNLALDPAGPRRLVGAGREQVEDRLSELRQVVDERLEAGRRELRSGPPPGTRYLVVVDGARRMRTLEGLAEVLRRGREAGVYALCIDDDPTWLPEESRTTVVAADPGATRVTVRTRGVAPAEWVTADQVAEDVAAETARAMAAVRDSSRAAGEAAPLPTSVRLLDLLELGDPTAAAVVAGWGEGGRTTRATIGVGPAGPFSVDIRRDGPHGLIAGTTGAGKSELLQSLVAALAVANRPDALNFVLVDYKGGSAFKECADLPHCVGMVTDLDGHLAARALASLTAELKRRETVLAGAGVANIEELWARAPGPALPRLLIVIDEFATLVEEVPDFVRGVVGIGMRGRSLGVHVVLATQRPAGVVSSELRANVNLRICLRVASTQDSTDVIDQPDAARISKDTPGRALALTGFGELTSFQAARVGVGRRRVAVAGPAATVMAFGAGHLGAARPPRPADDSAEADGPTDLTAVVAAVSEAARRVGAEAPPSPWLAPLPEVVAAGDLAGPGAGAGELAVTLGLADRPDQQSQDPFVVDLAQTGSLLVIGTPRSGRTTALRTVAAGLAERCGPAGLHMYGIDCGNRGLDVIEVLPHCGAVVSGDDPDRLGRLFDLLSGLAARRAAAGAHHPPVVVLFDRLEAFVARYSERDGGRLVDTLDRLVREGRSVGLYFVISGDRTAFTSRLASAVDARLALRQADRSDYSIIGLDHRLAPTRMSDGRAMWAQTGTEIQVATFGDDEGYRRRFAELAAARPETGAGERPRRVDRLPDQVTLAAAAAMPVLAVGAGRPDSAPTLGVGGDELSQVVVDLVDVGPGFVVAGPPRSGRSTALNTMIETLPGRVAGTRRVVAVAPRPSPLRDWAGRPGVAAVLTGGPAEVGPALEEVLGGGEPAAVFVDDAELLSDGPAARVFEGLVKAARDSDLVIVAGATTDDLLLSRYRGWLADLRRSRSGLLLTPTSAVDGEVFDLRLPRSIERWPAGRGLLTVRGDSRAVQVATGAAPETAGDGTAAMIRGPV